MKTQEENDTVFIVTRTSHSSLFDSNKPPVPEAFVGTWSRTDSRTVDDPKKLPINHGTDGDWYKRGTNHRIVDGCIARDFAEPCWFVRIGDLAELLDFCDRYGEVVLSTDEDEPPTLEIYDSYRE